MIELGRMEKISELREVWESEDGDFTPWLAREENLALLADAIGIDEGHARAWSGKGLACRALGREEEAEAALARGAEIMLNLGGQHERG
jgi:hypothetical protein